MPETVTLLDELRQRRETIGKNWDDLIDRRETERAEYEKRTADFKSLKDEFEAKDSPTDEERDAFKAAEKAHMVTTDAYNLAEDEFRSACEDFESDLGPLNDRIKRQEEKAERRAAAEKAAISDDSDPAGSLHVTEPYTYRKDNANDYSFYKDMLSTEPSIRGLVSGIRGFNYQEARERIDRHSEEMNDVMKKRDAERIKAAEQQVDEAEMQFRSSFPTGMLKADLRGALEDNPFERRANPSRVAGQGGEFVPPLWLVEDDWIPFLRAGRVIAPLCRNMPVPPGTDTIKLPKVKLGTEVAPQLMDNAGVASRDIETTFVEAAVKTLAGQEDVAIQLIEQSPGQVFDTVVQTDLLADYNLKVDRNVSFGEGLNVTQLNAGTIKGLYPTTNWEGKKNESTSAATGQTFLASLNCNWSWIAKERFNVQNVHHVIHPRRGAWAASVTDSSSEAGRLLFNATDFPNFNTAGLFTGQTPAEGYAFTTPLGPNVYITANISTEDNGKGEKKSGESHDYALTAKFDDVWFFESDLRTRVLPEVVSGTLQIRFQVYAYVALLVRYGPSIAIAVGKTFEEPKLGGFTF